MRPVVIVMVKAPRAGFAKTRLAPPLSEFDAASLAVCFVQDVVNAALRIVPNLIVAFAPHDGRALLEAVLPDDLLWCEQQGEDLGERLDAAITYAVNLGFSPIIAGMTWTPSPTSYGFVTNSFQTSKHAAVPRLLTAGCSLLICCICHLRKPF